jgi:hypothetical protein
MDGAGVPPGSECRRVSGSIGLSSKTGRMNEQIKAQLDAKPFKRFSIETNDGRSIEVPHPDHVIVGRFAVTIEDDDGIIRILAYRNISGLTIPTGNGE